MDEQAVLRRARTFWGARDHDGNRIFDSWEQCVSDARWEQALTEGVTLDTLPFNPAEGSHSRSGVEGSGDATRSDRGGQVGAAPSSEAHTHDERPDFDSDEA